MLSGMVECTKLAPAASLLKSSTGCAILPTGKELRGSAPTEGSRQQRGGVTAEDVPTASVTEIPSTTAGEGFRASGAEGKQVSGATNPDDAAFVGIFTSPHSSHVVRLSLAVIPLAGREGARRRHRLCQTKGLATISSSNGSTAHSVGKTLSNINTMI